MILSILGAGTHTHAHRCEQNMCVGLQDTLAKCCMCDTATLTVNPSVAGVVGCRGPQPQFLPVLLSRWH